MKATPAASVKAPESEAVVQLDSLRDTEGNPVVVRLRRLAPLEYAEIQGQLPGANPEAGAAQPVSATDAVARAIRLIVRSAIEPRFSESGEAGTVPIAYLGMNDIGRLAGEASRLCNGEPPSFRDGDGGGLANGGGSLAPGALPADPVGGAA